MICRSKRQVRHPFMARIGPVSAVLFLSASLSTAAVRVVSPDEVPRADASVLRALNSGAESVDVLVGLRDGTPALRTLSAHPDPAGEPARRLRRLAAQDALAHDFATTLRVRR